LLVCSLAAGVVVGCRPAAKSDQREVELLNVSYDPTREFYAEFNQAFAAHWKRQTGQDVKVEPSHGGSGKQARSVIDGMPADVVTLALASDIDSIAEKAGVLSKDWQAKLPENSCPYTSTIVFVVRKNNPKAIKDWDDLVKPDVEVVTPDPKTSGGARWNYLAAWGYVLRRELGDFEKLRDPKQAEAVARAQAKARAFVKDLYARVKVLDSGARGATLTFVQVGRGDCLLAWENEALYSTNRMKAGEYEIVVPTASILAEPPVAVVDKWVDKHGTRKVAEAYLRYLYSPEGRTLAAKHYFRPRDTHGVPAEYLTLFPRITLFTIDEAFGGWKQAQREHFQDGGVFDQITRQ
jgi:sulfate transport system substrate-binding protein